MLVKKLVSDFKPLLSTLARDFCVAVSFVICKNTKVHINSKSCKHNSVLMGNWKSVDGK